MATEDVIEGRCGCGACEWHRFTTRHWYFQTADGSTLKLAAGSCCPSCHYRLDPDGYARRMVDCTVERLRKLAIDWEQQAADDSGLAIAAKEDGDLGRYDEHSLEADEADASADALRELLPEESSDEEA